MAGLIVLLQKNAPAFAFMRDWLARYLL